jgi:beta-galactosidase/beta-glucuronidase
MSIPRSEYPRPQWVREEWLCLNGVWEFEIDHEDSGLARGLLERKLQGKILVPFCPESDLSGIGERAVMNAVWYRRTVRVPPSWAGRQLLLHFQAVDYDATVWVNGVEVVRHRGGWTPFTANLGVVETSAELTVVVRARDTNDVRQPRGKQCDRPEPWSDQFTRTTGIWQTVWLEAVPESYLLRPRITPDLSQGAIHVETAVRGPKRGLTVRATLLDPSGEVVAMESRADLHFSTRITLPIPARRQRVWSPQDPHLYDLQIEALRSDGTVVDRARTYAGLRSVSIDGKAVLLNGQPVFQRLVLDQGYYPDGVMTAPTDQALIRDVELAQAAGFNGARLHEKVFEERFLYHCDRLGHLVWGEFGAGLTNARWSADSDELEPTPTFITQWLETLERDYSHPSIIGWCPINESLQTLHDRITTLDDVTRAMFLAAKAVDQTRPVLDASGFSHRIPDADVYDSHSYEQDPAILARKLAGLAENKLSPDPDVAAARQACNNDEALAVQLAERGLTREQALRRVLPDTPWSVPYAGQPYFCSEFGGIWWNPDLRPDERSWGYGARPSSAEEFYSRFEGLTAVLLGNPLVFGYCYTQLTDVLQERNGIYRFDRSTKFDIERIRAAQSRPAAIEHTGSPAADECSR